MLELNLRARRGNFKLNFACRMAAPWTVVFGPSGAGKSTLLRLIAGLERPDSGHISLNGRTLTDIRSRIHLPPGTQIHQRSVGMVTQHSALFPHLSVAANVAYGIASAPRSSREQQMREALELVGGVSLTDRRPHALSGGEAQRVSLARAIAPLPRLLLLDEPLSALDAAARDQVLSKLQAWLIDRGIQAILVTHDAADALATEAEVAMLFDGTLTAVGPAREVLARERQRLLNRLGGPSEAQ